MFSRCHADSAGSYIIAVNASIVADSGGTCVCNEPPSATTLTPCETNTEYLLCVAEVKKDLVTATSAIAALGTFMMGLLANLYVDTGDKRARLVV